MSPQKQELPNPQATEDKGYTTLINTSIQEMFRDALWITLKNPSMALFILRTIMNQGRATRKRKNHERNGLHVPPFMIVSVTDRCNLACKGCYAQVHHRESKKQISSERLDQLFLEAEELGISISLIAGGEPLTRPDVLEITSKHPHIIFPLFTNGLLIDDNTVQVMKKSRNIVPVISIEGHAQETDRRRGEGVYEKLGNAIIALKKAGSFFGVSITVDTQNFNTVTQKSFVSKLIKDGCRLFFFVEYVPIKEGTDDLMLNADQRLQLNQTMTRFRAQLPSLFIAFPGDEEAFGGCLSAGRGFVHVSSEGSLEPCPFSPYSDTSITDLPLKEALRSPFLGEIRANHEMLDETQGGCALWEKREWVNSLLLLAAKRSRS